MKENYADSTTSGSGGKARKVIPKYGTAMKIVDFPNVFPGGAQDSELIGKLLDELPRIVSWMAEGAQAYLAQGLHPDTDAMAECAREFGKGDGGPVVAWARSALLYELGAFAPVSQLVASAQANNLSVGKVVPAMMDAMLEEGRAKGVAVRSGVKKLAGKNVRVVVGASIRPATDNVAQLKPLDITEV